MTRLLSLEIPFGRKQYTALVSVKEHGGDICCTVRYIDKELRHILSGDQLVFCAGEGLKEPGHLPNEHAESLYRSTTSALRAHVLQNKA